jgi:predicted metalloprotease with PDZ domain
MIHATSAPRGATEHINSTVIQRQRDRFASREDYVNFILTAAHELVHTWNVKAYRPAGLVPYDFQKENYTPLLWVAEGTTSYFDTLITRRAGIIDQKEFHKELAKSIEGHLNRPGRKVQSVAEASFYQWIESTNHFTINHGVNIYSEGSLVSWLLDFEIRNATDDQKSLEDVHRLLYQRFNAKDKGYTDNDLLALVNEVTGSDFSEFWKRYVWGTQSIDFESLLNSAGLELVRKPEDKQKIDLGWQVDNELKLTRVLKDSPAWNAGLTIGDILVSLDGLRLTPKNIEQRIEQLKPGKTYPLHFFRRDELQSVEVTAVKNPFRKLEIKPKPNATEKQKRRYQNWTGHALSLTKPLNQEIAQP